MTMPQMVPAAFETLALRREQAVTSRMLHCLQLSARA